jgi:hypothetical protein
VTWRFHSFLETNVLGQPYGAKLHTKVRVLVVSPVLVMPRRRVRPCVEVGLFADPLRTREVDVVEVGVDVLGWRPPERRFEEEEEANDMPSTGTGDGHD